MKKKLKALMVSLPGLALALVVAASCSRAYEPDLEAAWVLTVETTDSLRTTVAIPSSEAAAPIVKRKGGRTVVTYPSVGGKNFEVSFSYSGDAKSREVVPTVVNREDGWVVLRLTTPEILDLGVDVEKMKLLLPNGAGFLHDLTRIEDTRGQDLGADVEKEGADGKKRSFAHLNERVGWKEVPGETPCFESSWRYPNSRQLSMQWAQFSSGTENLYLASHDPLFRWKVFRFKYFPEEKRVSFFQENLFTCFPGETWNGPPTLIAWTEGSWKTGARTYRDWYHSVRTIPERPDWIRKSSGWALTILKNQNGKTIWSYPEVGTNLLDEVDRRGIDIVSLYGWTVGGHDRFYPDYDPDPLMGGEEALRESIRKIHERGKKVTLYFNGQLIDTNDTQFWPDTGRFITSIDRRGRPIILQYWKFTSTGRPRSFGKGCYGSEVWCKRLRNLAMMTHELGADGLIYDQMGVGHPLFCYGEGHGHSIPTIGYEQDRVAALERIAAEMQAVHPGFMLITEGLQDCEMNSVDVFWGYSPTSEQGPMPIYMRQAMDEESFWTPFPDMFRYTFPEAILIIRTPTPAATRGSLNFSTTFGYKHEIETRYLQDKRYLVEGIIPDPSEYDDIRAKPDIPSMLDQDPAEAVRYSKAVLDLRRRNEDLLYTGEYTSDDGFALSTDDPYVLARAFVSGKKMGIVVWNLSDEAPASFTVTPDKGWKFVAADAPDGEPLEGPLPAQSIRLLVFERDR